MDLSSRAMTIQTVVPVSHTRRLADAPRNDLPSPPSQPFSFNALLQSESLETIKKDVDMLSLLTNGLPSSNNGALSTQANDQDLDALIKCSGNILLNLNRLISLRDQKGDTDDDSGDSKTQHGVREVPAINDRKHGRESNHRSAAIFCHDCNTRKTPKWRSGPDGPGTLCNVCGLMYRKQRQRYARR